MSSWLTRRTFLTAGVGGLLAGWLQRYRRRGSERQIPGQVLGASASLGHRLREQGIPQPSRVEEVNVVIAGGGIAGLAAARRLEKLGCKDIVLLELERELGGNSTSGANEITAYPWGAHYVPLPNTESREVLELFEELGAITGWKDGVPVYEETMLCADPEERLFSHGRWHEGLVPQIGVSDDDRRQYERFFAEMERWRTTTGSDGHPAFAIPLDRSSRAPEYLVLDTIPMAKWLADHGFTSAPLRWYVDYSCRDDFGAGINQISAWAGIHYFAGRRGSGTNAARENVLTWPEGNGWIVKQIAKALSCSIRSESLVWRVEQVEGRVEVDYFEARTGTSVRLKARAVVCAMPRFVAQRIVPGANRIEGLEYSPWVVANITLDTLPSGRGAPLAWDNVLRDSPSLGYVVATHQHLQSVPKRTVITFYRPLDHVPPKEARTEALARSHADWCELILADLCQAHRDLREHVQQMDVWVWGHGMIRPVPGLLWGGARDQMSSPHRNVFFAHSDMSGMALFEEAYTRGVHAAEALWQSIT